MRAGVAGATLAETMTRSGLPPHGALYDKVAEVLAREEQIARCVMWTRQSTIPDSVGLRQRRSGGECG
ncbi:MAG: hypothetical protein JWO57_2407 [Pseudonocardiales bacterium]|nr:hypothetical protein [Pseudonocardiales bacterium]